MTTIAPTDLRSALRGLWWLILIRAILLVVLGILALAAPALTVASLVLLLGAYAVVDGVILIVTAISSRAAHPGWGWLVAQGALSVLAGLLVFTIPGFVGVAAVLTILWFIVISAIIGGILEIVAAVGRHSGGWAIASGALDILFGVALMIAVVLEPAATALTLVWIFGIYAIVFGVVLAVWSFRIRAGGAAPDRVAG